MLSSASKPDAVTAELVSFGTTLAFDRLGAQDVHEAKRRIVDTLGCAVGGVDAPPARIARALAAEQQSVAGARVLGLAATTSPEAAAFANTVMTRYLDFNDGLGARVGMDGHHPSDMIPGVLAVAEAAHAPGNRALLGIVAAYEASSSMPVHFQKLGWDQGIAIGVGVTVGAAVVLGLDAERFTHAIAMAVTPNIPLRITRSGELSMWKGAATAAASRNAVFSVELAAKGMTGPTRVFDGRNGLFEQVTGPFDVRLDPAPDHYRIGTSNIKSFPSSGMTHAVMYKTIDLTDGIGEDDIAAIEVRTHEHLVWESGGEPEKWDPQTRETADHSLPFVMAKVIRDRTLTTASFSKDSVLDPSLRPLMDKITVVEEPAFTASRGDPSLAPSDPAFIGLSEVIVTLTDGRVRRGRTELVRGHHLNPMTDAELEAKFRGNVAPVSTPARIDEALRAIWAIDEADDVGDVLAAWGRLVDEREI